MKIPKDKLPLNHYGTDRPEMGEVCDIYSKGLYEGHIKSNELTKYIVKAANEFPEAIELLRKIARGNRYIMKNNHIVSFGMGISKAFDKQTCEIEDYLNKLEDE